MQPPLFYTLNYRNVSPRIRGENPISLANHYKTLPIRYPSLYSTNVVSTTYKVKQFVQFALDKLIQCGKLSPFFIGENRRGDWKYCSLFD